MCLVRQIKGGERELIDLGLLDVVRAGEAQLGSEIC